MEISQLSGKRYELAMELFREQKDGLKYENIYFLNKGHTLEVVSFSKWQLDSVTKDMAKEQIARSKTVMQQLSELNPEFKQIEASCKKEYLFCYDYHTGGIMLANEINGVFEWHYKNH